MERNNGNLIYIYLKERKQKDISRKGVTDKGINIISKVTSEEFTANCKDLRVTYVHNLHGYLSTFPC